MTKIVGITLGIITNGFTNQLSGVTTNWGCFMGEWGDHWAYSMGTSMVTKWWWHRQTRIVVASPGSRRSIDFHGAGADCPHIHTEAYTLLLYTLLLCTISLLTLLLCTLSLYTFSLYVHQAPNKEGSIFRQFAHGSRTIENLPCSRGRPDFVITPTPTIWIVFCAQFFWCRVLTV